MRSLIAFSLFSFLMICLTGCGVTIVPHPHNPADKVNNSDRSITIQRDKLTLSARVQDMTVGGYSLDTTLTSFYVAAVNHTNAPISFPLSNFTLVDDQGNSYNAVSPSSVNALLLPEYDYLVPFPYVSFLDVVAQESQKASTAMQSEEPYVIGRSSDQTPAGNPFAPSINAGERGAGMVFFEIDLYTVNSIRLQVEDPTGHATYIFPFSVEK